MSTDAIQVTTKDTKGTKDTKRESLEQHCQASLKAVTTPEP